MKRETIVGLVIVLAISALSFAEQPEYKPGSVLVRFKNTDTQPPNTAAKNSIINSTLGTTGTPVKQEYTLVQGLAKVAVPANMTVENAVTALKKSSSVLYAEPDYIYHISVVPNDTSFSQLWGMTIIGAPAAWDISTGSSSIIVAVTDTGVDYTHPDLTANMWSDANGSHGYDFVNNDSDPMDDAGHGTHVSGTIGAVGNNGIGVAGVNWHTRIMALKFLDATGSGSTSNAVAAIQYAIANGAKVINASWGGYGFSQTLYDAIAAARDAGIIFVAAAGNENNDNDSMPAYPASFDLANIISVMATTNTDASASYSNYGLTTVDLGAPGGSGFGNSADILSTLPGGGYGYLAGTSMASPHVAGASALILSANPTLTYSQVKQILLDTVDKTLPGLCVSGGRLNLAAAVQEATVDTTPPTPDSPQWAAGAAPKATGRHTAIMQAATVTDRSGVEYYFECVSDVNKNSGWTANTLYTITTLAPNTTYGFHFKARDKSGNHNQTDWSTTGFVTTSLTNDNLGPFPDPPQWLTPPKANPQAHQIRMAAGIGYDESTPVQYQFSYQYKTNPEVILPWQPGNIYSFTPPSGELDTTVYNFRFHVRDANGNETVEWSMFASARMLAGSRVIPVPAQYGTIQPAIDNALSGDIVEISPYPYPPYTYSGAGNVNLTFSTNGVPKAITVRSTDPTNPDVVAATVIDCQGTRDPANPRRGFIFNRGEGPGSVLAGLTIRNGFVKGTRGTDGTNPANPDAGSGGKAFGGGIVCGPPSGTSGLGGSPTISNCVIEDCAVEGGDGGTGGQGDPCAPGGRGGDSGFAAGGGIYCLANSNPIIQNCIIRHCYSRAGQAGNGGNGGNGAAGGNGGAGGAGGWNNALAGGGIYINGSNPTIVGCTITDCNAFNLTGVGGPGQGGTGTPPGGPGAPGLFLETDGYGGGIYYSAGSSANISSTTISQNQIYGPTLIDVVTNKLFYPRGAGIFLKGGSVTMTDCNINNNDGTNGGCDGAGIANINALTLRNCNLTNNTASHSGGGLFAADTATIYDSGFTGNDAIYGGGIYLDSASLMLSGAQLQNNTATEGGGINGYFATVDIHDSNIVGNTANMPGAMGGGVAFWNSTGDINNCLLQNNVADSVGGAALTEGWTTSPLQFTNCLITDNEAFYEGGALSCNLSGWAKLVNCTLVGNSATSGTYGTGGAVSSAENFAWVQLENCILWENLALNGPQIAVGTIFGSLQDGASGPFADVDVASCDVEGGQDSVYIEDPAYTAVWWLAGNITDDPLFVDIDVNAPSYYLSQVKAGQSTNSPCVDAGSFAASVLKYLIGETLTTRTDSVEDANTVDMGYHYVAGAVAGGARQYNLTIEVYKFDPNEGGHGRLKAKSLEGSDYPFDINDTNTIQISQGTEVNLIAAPDPCFKVQYWSGTDNDGSTALTNAVTMNTDKTVVVAFAPNGLYYLTVTVIGNGTVTPLGRTLHTPGEVVALTAVPTNPTDKIAWTGTDDDASQAQTNTVTMTTNKNVTVEFYTPRILYVGGDSKYPTIQAAIDDANEGDIIILMPSDQPYYTQQGYLITKNITITSVDPYNPSVVASTVIQQQFNGPSTGGPAFVFANVGRRTRLMGITIQSFSGGGFTQLPANPSQTGYYDGAPGGWNYAMGIYCQNASPTIINCVLDDCHTYGDNGGLGAAGDATHPNGGNGGWPGGAYGGAVTCTVNSNPAFIGCTFSNNTAVGGNGGKGGDGAAPPTTGSGGRGGGWYYGYPIPSPWEYPIPAPGDLPKDYSGLGGAVYINTGCAPIFENCSFVNNFSTGGLNGICGANPPTNSVDEPTIRYKIANLGGAVYLNAGASAIFNGCEFTGNIADTNRNPNSFSGFLGYGGAVAAEDDATPTFIGCSVNGNSSDVGGGIYSSWAYPVIEDSIFSTNTAAHGGGVLISNSDAVISGSRFISNSANISGSEGGAIAALGANAEINDCNIFSNRSAGDGGGIYVSSRNMDGDEVSGGNSVLIKNCLITNNVADLDGGGIAAVWLSEPNIVNCTIVNNTAGGMGAGLSTSYGSFANVINSIIWGNVATKGSQIAVGTKDTNSPVSYPSTVKVRFSDVNGVKMAESEAVDANAVPVIRAGFVTDTLAANDDESTGLVDIGFTINFFGKQYSQLYVNNNGNVTFDANMFYYTPFGLTGNIGTSIIAPFFADVDTRIGNITAFGPNNVGDHNAFGVTWTNVGYFSQHTDKTNTFQMLLIDRSDRAAGDFDIEFNYERIQWETGEASGGSNGFGGQSAHAGFSNGSGNDGTFYEFPGSGVPGSFLDSGPAATRLINNSRSSAVPGRYIFTVRGGLPALLTAEPFYVNPDSNLDGFRFDTASNDWLPAADSNNIGADPCFVMGVGYFLSQIAAGQLFTSPCVDAGSADVNTPGIDLANYTTRTDSVNDVNIVDMGYHYTVTTTTAPQYSLTIEVVNDTGGTLTAQGGGDSAFTITAPVTVTRMVNVGTEVSLHAAVQAGFALLGWTGTNDDTSTSTDNTVTMNSNKVVKVTFHQYQLTIQVLKPGGFDPNGYLTATGDGIDPFTITSRNEPNSRSVAPGTIVQLTAFPDVNYNVSSWSGTDNDGSTALTNAVTMNSDVNVIVAFQPDGLYYLTVTVIGNGTVTPLGTTLHTPGEVVALTAIPTNPSDKISWTGTDDDASQAQTNTVTMTTHKNVTVEFYSPRILYVGGDSNYPNIQMAIDDANNRDIVMITPGFYNIVESSQDHSYLLIDGKDITITSTSPENPEATVITGKFMIYNVSRKCVIQGLTISGNVYWDDDTFDPTGVWVEGTPPGEGEDGPPAPPTPGAGMTLNGSASPTVRNVRFVNCWARGIHGGNGAASVAGNPGNGGPGGRAMGGGAYCGPDGSPLFENCLFTGCLARGGDGGNGGDGSATIMPGHGGAWGDKNWPLWQYPPMDYWWYTGCGGAVYCDEGSTAEFVNCNFIDNTTIGGSCGITGAGLIMFGWPYSHYKIQSFGGAVFAATGSAPFFTDCNFTDNMADPNGWPTHRVGNVPTVAAYPTTSYGGAIAFENGASPLFTKCTFTGNLAAVGGAVYCDEAYPEFDASAFIGNSALHGGGVMFSQGFSIVNQCYFTGNQGTYPAAQGGAIAALGANAEITDCNIFSNRSAGDGGGIYVSSRNIDGNEASGGNSVLIKNCLIANNVANLEGGGIAAVWFSDPNIVNCTIVNNTAGGRGAGVSSSYGSFVNLVNNIIWDNVTGIGANGSQLAVSVAPSAMLVHNSDVQGATDPNQFGRNIQSLDLVFCIDTTGSMADDIDAVKAAARQITNAIGAQFPDYRIALADYRDFYDDQNTAATYGSPGDRPYRDDVSFTTDASRLIAGLQPLVAAGGADEPEGVYAALMHCIDANALEARLIANGNARFIDFNSPGVGAWRQGRDVLRVVMLMGDAPPHDPEPYTDYTLNDIATAATGPNPVHVMPILIGNATDATTAFTSIATATGGTVVQAADANAVVGAVLQAVGLMKQIPTPIFVDVNCVINWDPCTMQWEPGSGNIDADPCFVAGYFLSQIAAGQLFTSPCVDAGSADANSPGIDLANYTTRTDSVGDQGVVDMGYHYPYHYPLFTSPQYRLDFNAVVGNGLLAGDIEPNSGLFNWFTTVTLRVNRDPNGFQVLWTGTDNDDANGTTNTVLMDRPRAVTVAFVSNACTLTTEVIGGHGTITPTGGTYSRNTVVALTAVPDAGYRVKSWTGTDNDGLFAPANTVKMAGDKHVTVEFEVPLIRTVPGDFTTIQGAVNAARTGDIVSVASGVYNTPGLVIDKEITITSTNPDDPCVVAMTVIDGNGIAGTGIVFYAGATGQTVLNGITIANCSYGFVPPQNTAVIGAAGPDGGSGSGAGIVVMTGSSPTIKNCIIRNCNITGGDAGNGGNADATTPAGHGGWGGWARGAGIYVARYASPTFINCTVRNCTVTGGNGGNGGNFADGGGDAGPGGNWSDGVLWQTWGYIGDYRFYGGYGAGVYCDANSSASFVACNIINNTASGGLSGIGGNRAAGVQRPMPGTRYRLPGYGGGVYCGENSNIEFTDCNIKGNLAPKPDTTYHTDPYLGHGGGIAFENTAFISLTGCNISDNISAVGGGMFWAGGAPTIRDCNISANTAYVGGGAYGKEGAPLIEDCNILRNFAGVSAGDVDVIAGQGGGIFGESMDTNIIDSRFVDNTTGASGAAIYFHGPVDGGDNVANVTNCLMIGNTAGRDGGGISANWNVSVKIANCTLHSNNATGSFGDPNGHTGLGGGLYCAYGASTSVIDSILWRNDANFGPEIAVDTGFELDQHCGSVNVSYSDVRGGSAGTYVGESGNCSANLTWAGGNIGVDPKFVSEIISDYRLQQVAAGQLPANQSPCVDAGSSSAINVGLGLYTTRTDEVPDRGKVDMGYHYAVEQPCRFVDIGNKILTGGRTKWMKDGIIDWTDFAVLADSWLSGSCSPANTWCEGADLTFNGTVNWEDLSLISQCWLAADTTAPSPNPSQWALVPMGVWPNKVKMAAVDTVDNLWGLQFDTTHPVQYQFQCTSGNGHDSGWQYDANYIDTGLQSYIEYAYRVRARDLVGNATEWSSVQWTVISPDSIPPTPNPMTWNVEPHAASGTSISMTATTASDDSGGIQYEFEINEPNIPVFTSGWRDDPNYTITGLDPVGPYCFRVKARDVFDNETGWSEQVCVSNLGDVTRPSPAPNIIFIPGTWAVSETEYGYSGVVHTSDARYWHRVVADVTGITDDSGGPLELRFICSNNSFSSQTKVGVPIIIGQPPVGGTLGGHASTNTYQVFWNGSTIVYDVYINSSSGLGGGGDYTWRVCVYDPTLNSACSDPVEIAGLFIGAPR